MKRRRAPSPAALPAAILAGGLIFSGAASAAIILDENFESGANVFDMPTYNYASGYTQPNGLVPSGGTTYGHGGPGTTGQISTNLYPVAAPVNVTLLGGGTGLTAVLIDTGMGAYDFNAQFSTYLAQNDYAEVSITFKDGANAPIGAPITLGGSAFVTGLGTGDFGLRAWGADTETGIIPAGARSVDVRISDTKIPEGTNIDGYLDNVSLNAEVVPEPGAAALGLLGALGLMQRRRRR